MQRTHTRIAGVTQDLLGAGLAIAVGLGILASRPLGMWFEQWSYELPYAVRPHLTATNLVFVSMDARSRAELAQSDVRKWDRELHEQVLNRLLARGARLVAFTSAFSERSPAEAADRVFAQGLRRAKGRVVLAGEWAGGGTNIAVLAPVPDLAAVAPWGVLSAAAGADEMARRLSVGPEYPTLAARAAELLGKPISETLHWRWLNYYAPELRLPEISYGDVLRGTDPPKLCKGKIVLVGPAAEDSELRPTPYSRWTGRRATRSDIEATAILNLMRGDWLLRLPPVVEAGILAITGGFFGLVFMGMRRGGAVVLACGAFAVVTAGAYVLFAFFEIVFPWLIVAAIQIPTALGWALLCETGDRRRASRSLSDQRQLRAVPGSGEAGVASAESDVPEIPDYTMLKRIGRGAYGEVWLARDVVGRHYAAKVVKLRDFPQPGPYEREFKGIQRFASISRTHPGLVQVLHVGRHDAAGYFFYIMELADAASGNTSLEPERYSPRTLASELAKRGHLPVRESVQIGLALSSALQHLHERQLIHRDIKPSNIIFIEGAPKFADIGLVAPLGRSSENATRLGTEGYLAPEGPGAATADVYALGKVLYEISMGRDRWQFPELPTTLGTRPEPETLRRLHEIILTACETEPSRRYQSAAEMHAALDAFGTEQISTARGGNK